MKDVNWNEVPDAGTYPVPGGYIAGITHVEDNEQKEYLRIEWEFFDGPYKGSNQETFERAGFWPYAMICSYKKKALPFFKGFKTSVEMSNRNFIFRNDPQSLIGKFIGVVLGEEEYLANDGSVKKRLYVAEKRSCKAIKDGDYKVPALKKLAPPSGSAPKTDFAPVLDEDADLPWA